MSLEQINSTYQKLIAAFKKAVDELTKDLNEKYSQTGLTISPSESPFHYNLYFCHKKYQFLFHFPHYYDGTWMPEMFRLCGKITLKREAFQPLCTFILTTENGGSIFRDVKEPLPPINLCNILIYEIEKDFSKS